MELEACILGDRNSGLQEREKAGRMQVSLRMMP
jgi:hypothetical protein